MKITVFTCFLHFQTKFLFVKVVSNFHPATNPTLSGMSVVLGENAAGVCMCLCVNVCVCVVCGVCVGSVCVCVCVCGMCGMWFKFAFF